MLDRARVFTSRTLHKIFAGIPLISPVVDPRLLTRIDAFLALFTLLLLGTLVLGSFYLMLSSLIIGVVALGAVVLLVVASAYFHSDTSNARQGSPPSRSRSY